MAGSIMLAGVMSKLGAYGMLRVALPLFPEAAQLAAPVVGALALAGVIVGALGALRHAGGESAAARVCPSGHAPPRGS